MSTTVTIRCAGTCNKNIHLTDTSSMYRPTGHSYDIYCHDCYKAKEKTKETK